MKKRKDGRYIKTVKIDGVRRFFYSSAPTERQAEKDIAQQLLTFKEKEKQGKLFREAAEEWEKEHYTRLAYSTEQRYKPLVRCAVEYFDGSYIKDIQPTDIARFMKYKISKGYAGKTVSHQMSVLNMIFEHACIAGYIQNNPCQFVHVPGNLPKKKRGIPSVDEIERIKANTDKPFGLLAYFLLYSGLRKGEALALTYSDIDFKNKMINVTKSVYYESNTPHIKSPKTEAGARKVILLDCLAEKLPKRKIGLVFHNESGTYMTHHEFAQGWKRYQKETGITATPHQLRHAYASYILHDSGIDIKTAQELMGHADISTTQNIYTQITEMRLAEAAKKLNERAKESSQNIVKNLENG